MEILFLLLPGALWLIFGASRFSGSIERDKVGRNLSEGTRPGLAALLSEKAPTLLAKGGLKQRPADPR